MENVSSRIGTILHVHSIHDIGIFYSVMFSDGVELLDESQFHIAEGEQDDD